MPDQDDAVRRFYDASAARYHEAYERESLHDTSIDYPANYFRLQLLLNSFISRGAKRVIEVGVGEGTPLATLARAGIDVWGFDISEEMVQKSKEQMTRLGLPESRISWGDVEDPTTYVQALQGGQFDALMAMGVMPHIRNDDAVLDNMASLVRPGGTLFVEFRNKLFSLFTFNRYTADFVLNDLLDGVSPEVKKAVEKDLAGRLRMDMPPVRSTVAESDAPGYDAILSRFHNPFEVEELFRRHNLKDIKFLWYHYHPAMPYLESEMRTAFREESLKLEHESSGWRGLFLCSAFVVEATKGS